ncbi:PREDICTED: arylsulfatase B-like isoform X2 [Priapulus caudatus]|uniref:Arylsulfatase B-like isoform X2 n=1 Tax=Priapulus caudatus TaxID=37621 RepID=A0ABM1EXZ2_PRICU|nr:PREDICTED: arylsulfatase B-like isoform X2 [Priapulus caudatus]
MKPKTRCLCVTLLLFANNIVSSLQQTKQPNIVFIVADDLGWNDVGWNNPEMITPNLDKLAHGGVILNHSYVQPVCSPSRTAFMTGYYPFRVGLQPHGVQLNKTFLPQELKRLGYATHVVGKWHLGFCKWAYTPLERGFDSFLGYYTGSEDYYTHERTVGKCHGIDLRFNNSSLKTENSTYSTHLFARRAVDVINEHDTSRPLFMYLPFQAVHSPLQVPAKYSRMYEHIRDHQRRKYCGMVSALDEAVGNVTAALKRRGQLENTLIVFTTDNGGQTKSGGNNYPLRGNKATLWEGGTRGVSFVHGAGVGNPGSVRSDLFHAVDWFPTIVAAAQGKTSSAIDGLSHWASLSKGKPGPRHEFVYNIDQIKGNSAIRLGQYKLIEGPPGEPSGWIFPPTSWSGGKHIDRLWGSESAIMDRQNVSVYLFNLEFDPNEHYNLADVYPELVASLSQRLAEYHKQAVWPDFPPDDSRGDPAHFKGFWSPGWC